MILLRSLLPSDTALWQCCDTQWAWPFCLGPARRHGCRSCAGGTSQAREAHRQYVAARSPARAVQLYKFKLFLPTEKLRIQRMAFAHLAQAQVCYLQSVCPFAIYIRNTCVCGYCKQVTAHLISPGIEINWVLMWEVAYCFTQVGSCTFCFRPFLSSIQCEKVGNYIKGEINCLERG